MLYLVSRFCFSDNKLCYSFFIYIYIDFKKEVNDKGPKFKVGDHVRISKYKNIFAKGYTPNWSEEVFVIKKVKWMEKFRKGKVIKKKGDKLYVKWKGYDSTFNSWIDKKYIT